MPLIYAEHQEHGLLSLRSWNRDQVTQFINTILAEPKYTTSWMFTGSLSEDQHLQVAVIKGDPQIGPSSPLDLDACVWQVPHLQIGQDGVL